MLHAQITLTLLGAVQDAPSARQPTPPELLNGEKVIQPGDYPQRSAQREEYGTVTTLLRVSAHGRVEDCVVTESSGHPALDMRSCALWRQRARFRPATDANGAAASGEYWTANSWGLNDNQPRVTSELTLRLPTLPQGYRAPLKVQLRYSGTGQVSACEVTRTTGSADADQAVCAYLIGKMAIAPFGSGSDGIAAVAVRYATIELRTVP